MMHDTLPYASEDLMMHRILTCELEDKINQAKEMHKKFVREIIKLYP